MTLDRTAAQKPHCSIAAQNPHYCSAAALLDNEAHLHAEFVYTNFILPTKLLSRTVLLEVREKYQGASEAQQLPSYLYRAAHG